jgi:hypothetical protein
MQMDEYRSRNPEKVLMIKTKMSMEVGVGLWNGTPPLHREPIFKIPTGRRRGVCGSVRGPTKKCTELSCLELIPDHRRTVNDKAQTLCQKNKHRVPSPLFETPSRSRRCSPQPQRYGEGSTETVNDDDPSVPIKHRTQVHPTNRRYTSTVVVHTPCPYDCHGKRYCSRW